MGRVGPVLKMVMMYRVGTGKLALTAGALTVMLGLSATVTPASATNAKRSSGSFTLTGAVAGELKVGHTSCLISTSQPNTEWITWHSVKLNIFGKSKTLSSVKIEVQPSEFGMTNTLDFKAVNVPVGTVGLSIGPSPIWIGNSGTVTTSEGGTSGSVNGSMILPLTDKQQPGTVGIVGSWAGCAKH